MGAMTPPNRKRRYNFRVVEINRVLDGDTIDVTIDLEFDLFEKVRVAGVDTPEKEREPREERPLESTQPMIPKKNWKGVGLVMMISLSVLNLLAVSGSTVVFLVGYTLGTEVCRSTNK